MVPFQAGKLAIKVAHLFFKVLEGALVDEGLAHLVLRVVDGLLYLTLQT